MYILLISKKHETSPRQKLSAREGFTILEMLVVLGILAVIFGLGLIVSLDFYRQKILSVERDAVVSVLRRARSEALNNVNQSNHGVYLAGSNYVIFQGNYYASRNPSFDEIFDKSNGVTVGGLSEIVFSSLAGGANVSGTVSLSNGTQILNVSVNSEGRIDW